MALIYNENDTLRFDILQVFCAHFPLGILTDIAHLLDRRNDQGILRIYAFQLADKSDCVLSLLHIVGIVRKGTVLLE